MRALLLLLVGVVAAVPVRTHAQDRLDLPTSPEDIGAVAYLLNAHISCARGDLDAPRKALLSASNEARRAPQRMEGMSSGIRRAFDQFLADGGCLGLPESDPEAHRRYLEDRGDSVRARAHVSGVASLLWGAPVSAIVGVHGAPTDQQVDAEAGILILHYAHEKLFDAPAQLYFVVHRTEGLIGGGYTVPIGLNADCDRMFDRYTDELRRRYSRIRPSVRKQNYNQAMLFCHSLRFGRAVATARWLDPSGHGGLYLTLGGETLSVLYSTPRYDTIREWQQERDRWRAF